MADYNLSALMEQKRSKARLRELQKHVDVGGPVGSGAKRS